MVVHTKSDLWLDNMFRIILFATCHESIVYRDLHNISYCGIICITVLRRSQMFRLLVQNMTNYFFLDL